MPRSASYSLTLSLLLLGCPGGAGGGGNDGPLLTLDEATVDLHLDRVESDLPWCVAPEVGAAARSLGRSSGSCGGSLSATRDHGNGDTEYLVALDDFCMDDAGQSVLATGTLRLFEDGTPSDFGPVIASHQAATQGPIALEQAGGNADLDIEAFRIDYGYPDVTPGAPDESHPDVLTLGAFEMTQADGRVDFVRHLRVEAVGSSTVTLEITDGAWGAAGEGHVAIRTAADDPLIIDRTSYALVGGTLELVGEDDVVLALQPDPARPGVYTLTLDGAPFDREVDCGAANAPLTQLLFAVLAEAPIF